MGTCDVASIQGHEDRWRVVIMDLGFGFCQPEQSTFLSYHDAATKTDTKATCHGSCQCILAHWRRRLFLHGQVAEASFKDAYVEFEILAMGAVHY